MSIGYKYFTHFYTFHAFEFHLVSLFTFHLSKLQSDDAMSCNNFHIFSKTLVWLSLDTNIVEF